MTAPTPRQRRLALGAWLAVCLIWGTTYLGIRIALESMPPMVMAGLRWTVAGGALAIYMRMRGAKMPGWDGWRSAALLGFLMLVLGNGGVVWAELSVPSGLTAVVIASSPFWMAGVEAMYGDGERLTRRTAAGFVLGFAGILLLIWPDLTLSGARGGPFLLGMLALQVASLGWSVGSSYSRRHTRADNVFTATAAQMLAGGVMMLAIGTARGEWTALSFTARSATAFLYLSTIGAIGGFVAYTYALRHLPVSLVSLYAYINPIIAVALGVAVLGEPFTLRMAIAAAFVLVGVAIVPRAARPGRTAPVARSDAPAADQPHQEEYDGNDQQHVDEVAQRVAADHAEQPENNQNDRNRLEHRSHSWPAQQQRLCQQPFRSDEGLAGCTASNCDDRAGRGTE